MFKALYILLLGNHTDFAAEYEEQVFMPVGICMIVVPFVLSLLFFAVLNRQNARFRKRAHWWLAALFSMLIVSGIGIALVSQSTLSVLDLYAWMFALMSSLLTIVLFFIFSLFFKRFSIHAKHIPF